MITFGHRLKEMRIKKKLSLQALASKAGVHKSTIANYQSDLRHPPIETLNLLACILETSTDYLLGKTDIPDPLQASNKNIKNYLASGDLHWDGIVLSSEDMKVVLSLFEHLANLKEQQMETSVTQQKNQA